MNINITGHHVEVTPALREYVVGKIDRVLKHFDHVTSVHVVLSVEKLRQKAEITLHVKGKGINADTPGVATGVGLYNVAMLVRIAGAAGQSNVSDPANKYFYVDDGSGLVDGTTPGIKVLCGSVTPPSSGNVTVTGLVGLAGGKPVIIIRDSNDIR